jgi:serine/threonine protein kinase
VDRGSGITDALAGRFRIERELSRGGMAIVYLARDLKQDRMVALKVIHPYVAPQIFAFPDPDVRIDYPTWSPDGRWVLFDRAAPKVGDLWLLEAAR